MMMKSLADILQGVDIVDARLELATEVNAIQVDSRLITDGDVFVAVKGVSADGHDYVESARTKGAKVIIATKQVSGDDVVVVKSTDDLVAKLAANYYDYPSECMTVIGVTGTNGKTTVSTLLYQALRKLGKKVGLISTVDIRINDDIRPSALTTPGPIEMQKTLREMLDAHCDYVVMEVSSHAIHQSRIDYVEYDCGVFMNITHDHLDYHKSFSEYIRVKKMFFDSLKPNAIAISNIDDKNGKIMLQNTAAKQIYFGLLRACDYKAKVLEASLSGLHLVINGVEAYFRLIGQFNAYNLLAALSCLVELDVASFEECLAVLSTVTAPEGRLDVVSVEKKNAVAVIDYAHTPDALENVLKAIKGVTAKRIITVVGYGGDRDKLKRPKMAKIAVKYSNQVILTSDNPRTENPETILDDMEAGIDAEYQHDVFRITNRAQAIKMGVNLLDAGDVLLIAGKGHEKYQDVNGVKLPFDDKRKVMEFSKR